MLKWILGFLCLLVLMGCEPKSTQPTQRGKMVGSDCRTDTNCAVMIESALQVRAYHTGTVDYSKYIGREVGVVNFNSDTYQVIPMD